jgi:hypothetical protein
MIETIYIEENIQQHPRVLDICARFPKARKVSCGRREVINYYNSLQTRYSVDYPQSLNFDKEVVILVHRLVG